jgi:hypothetical protein
VWIDRYEIAIVGFLFGALFRLTWEGTGYEVVVDPDKISVHTSSTLRVHEKSVIKELVARTPRSDHLLLRIDWMEKKKRPLMAYGHVEDPETKLNELSQHYKVVRLEEPQVS